MGKDSNRWNRSEEGGGPTHRTSRRVSTTVGDRHTKRSNSPARASAAAHRGTLDDKGLAPAGGSRALTEFGSPFGRSSAPPPHSLTRMAGRRAAGLRHMPPDRPASVAFATALRGLSKGSQSHPESPGGGT